MEINQVPKPGTRVRIVTRNVIGHETEDTGTVLGGPFRDGFIGPDGRWSYQRVNQRDKICYKIMISVRRDCRNHQEVKSVPFRIDKILRLERVNGSK